MGKGSVLFLLLTKVSFSLCYRKIPTDVPKFIICKQQFHILPAGMSNGAICSEEGLVVSQKVKHTLSILPTILLLSIYPRNENACP